MNHLNFNHIDRVDTLKNMPHRFLNHIDASRKVMTVTLSGLIDVALRYTFPHSDSSRKRNVYLIFYLLLSFEYPVKITSYAELKQVLSSNHSKNIRSIEKEPLIFKSLKQFNQQILGPKLAKSLNWDTLLSLKIKYLFTRELAIEIKQVFKKIETKFYQGDYLRFSSEEKILFSFMRALALWDNGITILIIEEHPGFVDKKIKELFLKCLSELSDKTSIYWSPYALFHLNRPGKIILNNVN